MPDVWTNTLVKLKTGTVQDLEHEVNNAPDVPLEEGTIYFAIDTTTNPNHHTGKIAYDAPDGNGGVTRVIMSTLAEKADTANSATNASFASNAGALSNATNMDGILYDGTNNIIHYGVCETLASTQTKTVNVGIDNQTNNFRLVTGAKVNVKYTYTNTRDNPMLSVSGTEAKPIYYQGVAIDGKHLKAGDIHQYVYDGNYWVYVGSIAENVLIWVSDATETLFITTSASSGDGVRY